MPEQLAEQVVVGPKGCVRISEKNVPTTTGLMKSGMTNSVISQRLPRNERTIASASARPSASSKATHAKDNSSVTQRAC